MTIIIPVTVRCILTRDESLWYTGCHELLSYIIASSWTKYFLCGHLIPVIFGPFAPFQGVKVQFRNSIWALIFDVVCDILFYALWNVSCDEYSKILEKILQIILENIWYPNCRLISDDSTLAYLWVNAHGNESILSEKCKVYVLFQDEQTDDINEPISTIANPPTDDQIPSAVQGISEVEDKVAESPAEMTKSPIPAWHFFYFSKFKSLLF